MDREYLADYEQKEKEEFERLVERKIQEGKFDFGKETYPPDERFVKLQKPIARMSFNLANVDRFWTQIPFCGSTVFFLRSEPQSRFEEYFFKISDIPKIIDFVKETGRLQIVLKDDPTDYEGLEYLNPFFDELRPPVHYALPSSHLGNKREVKMVRETFFTLARVRFLDYCRRLVQQHYLRISVVLQQLILRQLQVYTALKLGRYAIVDEIENLMVDNPMRARDLLDIYGRFVVNPIFDLRHDLWNFGLEDIKESKRLPLVYQPEEVRFPHEIGKFLLNKLTYAAQDMRACYELMDHYEAYDLQNIQKALNDAIVTNHSDVVNASVEGLSEILDNVWNDPTIPRQIKNLKRGIPMSIAAIGTAVSAFTGGIGGFLAGLGFNVGAKFLDAEIEGLSEKVAKFFARSYQANVYDFKKKYEKQIRK